VISHQVSTCRQGQEHTHIPDILILPRQPVERLHQHHSCFKTPMSNLVSLGSVSFSPVSKLRRKRPSYWKRYLMSRKLLRRTARSDAHIDALKSKVNLSLFGLQEETRLSAPNSKKVTRDVLHLWPSYFGLLHPSPLVYCCLARQALGQPGIVEFSVGLALQPHPFLLFRSKIFLLLIISP